MKIVCYISSSKKSMIQKINLKERLRKLKVNIFRSWPFKIKSMNIKRKMTFLQEKLKNSKDNH